MYVLNKIQRQLITDLVTVTPRSLSNGIHQSYFIRQLYGIMPYQPYSTPTEYTAFSLTGFSSNQDRTPEYWNYR